MIVFAGICFVKVLPAVMNKGLAWMGGISAALFVCHPITRKVFIPISRQGDMYTGLLLYIVSSIVLAVVVSMLIKRFPNPKS
jgi:peptidoglycan/LPS O-acetylase OafA/YrhL